MSIALDTAITGTVLVPPPSPRVAEIIADLAVADAHEAISEGRRWEAARKITAELDDGKSQRELAAEIGRSQTYVSRYARIWRGRESLDSRGPGAFGEAFAALSAKPAPAAIGARAESPETQAVPIPERARRELAAARACQDAAGEMLRAAGGAPVSYEQAVKIGRCLAGADAALNRSVAACLAHGIGRLQMAGIVGVWMPENPPAVSELLAAVAAWPAGPLAKLAMADDELRVPYLERSGSSQLGFANAAR
jgi:hypothetical protein